jgi:hypothetical protein
MEGFLAKAGYCILAPKLGLRISKGDRYCNWPTLLGIRKLNMKRKILGISRGRNIERQKCEE